MSTILNALQKQNMPQVSVPYDKDSNNPYKVALLASLFIIILLICVLVMLLLRPLTESPVKSLSPVVKNNALAENVSQHKPALKSISRVSFPTVPLSVAEDKVSYKQQVSQLVVETEQHLNNQYVHPNDIAEKLQPAVLSVQSNVSQEAGNIDYSNVSQELQSRFQQALFISKDEVKHFIDNDIDDGSDIYQMAGDFQHQVPAFSYDFHVYSSNINERWIRINGEDLTEGQFDRTGKIQVVEIQPNRTIFRMGSQSFSLQSLTDWQGLQ